MPTASFASRMRNVVDGLASRSRLAVVNPAKPATVSTNNERPPPKTTHITESIRIRIRIPAPIMTTSTSVLVARERSGTLPASSTNTDKSTDVFHIVSRRPPALPLHPRALLFRWEYVVGKERWSSNKAEFCVKILQNCCRQNHQQILLSDSSRQKLHVKLVLSIGLMTMACPHF